MLGGLGCADAPDDDAPAPVEAASPCEEDPRAVPLSPGARFGDSPALVIDRADPEQPVPDVNTWWIAVDGASDCVLEVSTWMPDHGHGGPAPVVGEGAEGQTELSLRLTMGGYWEVTVDAACADAVSATWVVPICAE